jgi:chromatin remodeling complex protein RSC6
MATETAAKKAAAALAKPVLASPALRALLGLAPAATTTRAAALQGVWAHIKAAKLQREGAKSVIVPDERLAAVFGAEPVKMTAVMGLLAKHLTAIKEAAAPAAAAAEPAAPAEPPAEKLA